LQRDILEQMKYAPEAPEVDAPARVGELPQIALLDEGKFHHFGGNLGQPMPHKPDLLLQIAKIFGQTHSVVDPEKGFLNTPDGANHKGLPAGYSYLFQLATHDLVQTSLQPQVRDGQPPVPVNLRRTGLDLETVFGGGPVGCPFAYNIEYGKHGAEPAIKRAESLRIGNFWHSDNDDFAEEGDLPRGYFNLDPLQNVNALTGDGKRVFSEVLVADARNDDNPILAQLTIVFHRLYNRLLEHSGMFDDIVGADPGLIARTATARIYRRILKTDLMPRILHDKVLQHAKNGESWPEVPTEPRSVSLEFAFGVVRAAHSMVRNQYFLNDQDSEQPLNDLLELSSQHHKMDVPLLQKHKILWDLFFDLSPKNRPSKFNWAIKFGPHLASWMNTEDAGIRPRLPGETGKLYHQGTIILDLLRDWSGWLVPVSDILQSISKLTSDHLTPELLKINHETIIRDGFQSMKNEDNKAAIEALQADTRFSDLVKAPPLSLFVLFEAQQLGNEGRTFGPLGSFIVAHEMRRVFQEEPDSLEHKRAANLEQVAFRRLKIETMPELLDALEPNSLIAGNIQQGEKDG